MKLTTIALWPFGRKIRTNKRMPGLLSLLMNILWILLGGLWICLSHFLLGILLFITIIGIPFAKQHFKLASLALAPFGKEVIQKK